MKAVIRGTVRKRTSVSLTSATLLPGDDVEELADLLVGVVGDEEIAQCRDGAPVVAHLLGRELLGVVAEGLGEHDAAHPTAGDGQDLAGAVALVRRQVPHHGGHALRSEETTSELPQPMRPSS